MPNNCEYRPASGFTSSCPEQPSCLISSTNLSIYPVLTSANNAPGPLSEGFAISLLAQTLPSSMATITSMDSLPNIVPLHEPCYPPTLMTASISTSHYMLDVLLPGTICSPMVVISFHGSDYMGRERLKVLAEDWDKPGESHFKFEWNITFPPWQTHMAKPSCISATLEVATLHGHCDVGKRLVIEVVRFNLHSSSSLPLRH
ncbi:hypothetical protein L208DRAFT_1388381 [Tricholoma matsutake]|nr:hypothetical protein L208DRAFT_1388381 [Tricholoma matsutake 945]